jgi:hypothetical protein
VFAQSLLEYGAASSWVASMQALWVAFTDTIADTQQSTWISAGVFVLLLMLYWNRRSARTRR